MTEQPNNTDPRWVKRYLTVKEVAEYLQLSPDTVYMYTRTGVIPATKIGKHWRFSIDRLEQWMNRQEEAEVSAPQILLIEPDLQIAEVFRTWFAEAGCEVSSVMSPERAYQLLSDRPYDAVMLDLTDPRLGGLATFRQIRDLNPRAEVVVCSSHFHADLMNGALDIGPLTALRKPITKADITRLADMYRQKHAAPAPAHEEAAMPQAAIEIEPSTLQREESPRSMSGLIQTI